MKRISLSMAAVILLAASSVTSLATPPDAKKIHAEGCVEAGVEADCLVVKDVKTAKLYNILIKGARPAVGEGIDFTGVAHEGVTTCMQGIAVEVDHWQRKDSLQCQKSPAPAK
ncbi:MAG TPA: hypothetical protein VG225_00400 [Terracidiphilus sp.]|jgi:adenine deaminase|nr:hypothetical protein [Terracidiphilus sp.]